MNVFLLRCVLLCAMLQRSNMEIAVPATVLNCCEGHILLLLDSSGSIANYEFLRLLHFVTELLRPFSLGPGHVRVGLLQVGTNPNLEFGLDVHSNQSERLRVVHLTSHSAVLQWRPVLSADNGYYELSYKSRWKTDTETRRILPGDSSWVELTKLQPETTYTAALRPEYNQRLFNTLSVNFTTLPDVLSPTVVSVSDSGPRQIRVSWGPLQPARVQRYTVEYGAIPSGHVHTATLPNQQNSTLLNGLEPGTTYLVTVSALHVNGKERAMSVRACTQEAAALPALADLQLTTVERQEVQVTWKAHREGLKGYWLSWEGEFSHSSSSTPFVSSMYLPHTSRSTRLTRLAPSSRVCVSPVFGWGRGDGLCCTAERHTRWLS